MKTDVAKEFVRGSLSGIGLPVWYEERGADAEAYILISNIYNGGTNFADDSAQDDTHRFYIYCFVTADQLDSLDSYMDEIKATLLSVGLDLIQHNMPTVDNLQSEYRGRYSEFELWG